MLWRPSRPTRIVPVAELPSPVEDGVWVGVLGDEGLRDAAIWRKLFATSGKSVVVRTLFIAPRWTAARLRTAKAAFSPSELASVEFVEDPEGRWTAMVDPEDLTFVFLVRSGKVALFVAGGPTDEAWDRFEELL